MSTVTVTHTVTALPSRQYRAWRLTSSATDAVDTDGNGTDDPSIFVIRVDRKISGTKDVFSHVASLWEMNNVVTSKTDIPPKSDAFYRSSVAKLDFMSRDAVDEAIELINGDVNLLMQSASNTDVEEEIMFTA